MLDMGFMPQVREIVSLMGPRPSTRQALMFSATWPPSVHAYAKEFLSDSLVRISTDQGDSDDLRANVSVTQTVEIVLEARKEARLLEMLSNENGQGKILIFANTKKGCAVLADRIRRVTGLPCGEIHGNLTQNERESNLTEFASGLTRCLVATDVAARGLDVEDITLVICYDFPDSMVGGLDDYVHRIGRTGRAGRSGRAFTFFPAPADVSGTRSAGNAHEFIKILRSAGQEVPTDIIALDNGPTPANVEKGKAKGKGKGQKGHKTCKYEVEAPRPAADGGAPAKRMRCEHGVSVNGVFNEILPCPILDFKDAPFGRKLLSEIKALGFKAPTPIQAYGWPLLLSGRDCIGIAKTGSGKTLAFLLPAIAKMQKLLKGQEAPAKGAGPLALVLAPTRELAVQIHGESLRFAAACSLRTVCAYGGVPWEPQAALFEDGVEFVVATPGRLAFLMGRGGEEAATLLRTLAACGSEKRLADALGAFRAFIAKGKSPTRRIFSTLMNTHVVCGDRNGAAKLAREMEVVFPLGVVEFTTLLKGELSAGDLPRAQKIIDTMLGQSPPVYPDLRAVNTFLRGCLKLGEISAGLAAFERLGEWEVAPDAATYKIIVHSLGQRLMLKDMRRVLGELEAQGVETKNDVLEGLDNAVALNVSLAQVACMLGKRKVGRRLLSRAQEEAQKRSAASREQFDALRRQELSREIASLRGHLEEEEVFDLVGCLGRLFAFPAQRSGVSTIGARESVFEALRRGFGVDECVSRGLCSEKDFTAQLHRCLKKDGTLRWSKVFQSSSGLPTKLEVCSGSGDWVIAQAAAEVGRANWVASELRYDRVHSIFSKAVINRVDNLSILAGDAGSILRECMPAASLSHVCVNFPEPPQTSRHASCDDAESELHLLTADFFKDVHHALQDNGILTIFSDHQEYMRSLARTLGGLCENGCRIFAPFSDLPMAHLESAEQMDGVLICAGAPNPEAGHAVAAASQFDRFFQHGQHKERYYIAVEKG